MSAITPQAVREILAWQQAHVGQIEYSETAGTRLDAEHLLTPTDCSGMAAKMFKAFAGIDIGTYTGNECAYGSLLTTSKDAVLSGDVLLPGDCVLFDWDGDSVWDHIAIYAGNGQIWNHGGPGNGPLLWDLAGSVNAASHVMARRFVPWPTTPTAQALQDAPLAKWPFRLLSRSVFGSGSPAAVADAKKHRLTIHTGRRNAAELACVARIQHALTPWVPRGMTWTPGTPFGDGTALAVRNWQAHTHRNITGRIARSDWKALIK